MSEPEDSRSEPVPPKRMVVNRRRLLLVVGVLCIGFALIYPAVQAAREAARRQRCVDHLKYLGIAFHNYHDIYGCFPTPFRTDANGTPMHSWRVAIAPYVASSPFHDKYDFGEPWDSPKNLALAAEYPSLSSWFSCPTAAQPQGSAYTNYVMIVGRQRHGPSNKENSSPDHPDAIMVAEVANSDIHWTEPRDLNFDEMSFQINDMTKPSISSHHLHGAMVVFADGSTHFLDDSTDPENLKALLTENLDDASGRTTRSVDSP